MVNLKNMMDNELHIADLNQQIHQFIHSADGYDNRLKNVFVLIYLITEATKVIRSVDTDGFISDIRSRIHELDEEAVKLKAEYYSQLAQNDTLIQILADSSANRVKEIQHQISTLLNEYDELIKVLVETREKMSIEEQIVAENNNATNA